MKKARRLVCETNMKFGEIADALGYANQNYFTRLFTKYFGESPRAVFSSRIFARRGAFLNIF